MLWITGERGDTEVDQALRIARPGLFSQFPTPEIQSLANDWEGAEFQ